MSTPDGGIDVLIRGARIVDGTGNPWFHGDVALGGDRVRAITRPGMTHADQARAVVEAEGMVVCPGFIDIMSHSIIPHMLDGRSLSKITQGVTTEIMGEGWTPAPAGGLAADPFTEITLTPDLQPWAERARGWRRFRDWLDAMVEHGVSPNIGSFLGGGTLRVYARGMNMGRLTDEELTTTRRVMAEAMEDGAFGVAHALIYPPDAYVSTEEIIEECKVVSRYGGLYISHLRSEADRLLEGVEESLRIGRESQVPVQIYHLKAAGRGNWSKMAAVIDLVNATRASGQDVTADMYPYVGGGTALAAIAPPWVSADGKFFDNLRDPAVRARVRAEILRPTGEWEPLGTQAGPDGIMLLGLLKPEHQQYVGKRLSEVAALRERHWIDVALDLLLVEQQGIFSVFFMMCEENVTLQLRQPWVTISTDAGGCDPDWPAPFGMVHPRSYGTYPRVLGKYARDEGTISLEDAVRKMSAAVASRLGLRERGLLREGYFADVVIFDPATVADRATFTEPRQLSTGMRDVWVNGVRVLANGAHTGALPGRIVSGPGRA